MDGAIATGANFPESGDAMERPVRIGIIGAGMIGQAAHLANFVAVPDCRVVALSDLRPELCRQVAAKFGVPALYENHRQLLDQAELDAVVVVTRRPALGPIICDALEAGAHVLSEKPAAHTVAQASKLADIATANSRTFAVGFMKRHDAGVAHAKALFDELRQSGALGRVLLLRVYCHSGDFAPGLDDYVMTDEERPDGLDLWPAAPEWLPKSEHEDYANFLNIYVHDLNLLRHFLGHTPEVTAVDFRRANGRLVMFDCGDHPAILEMAEVGNGDWREGMEILFEYGALEIRLPAPLLRNAAARVTLRRHGANVETVDTTPRASWAFRRQAEAFVADIKSGDAPPADGQDSVQDLVLAEAIWRRHLER